jgi:hypothetical protein
MAFASLQHVLIDNANGTAGLLAGMAVHLTSVSGAPAVVAADRSDVTHRFYGVVADDTTTTGNTSAIVDPVGNYSHDGSDGYSMDGLYPHGPDFVTRPARRLGDYRNEAAPNDKNWTTPPGTMQRGVTVYRVGGRFLTDQFVGDQVTRTATTDQAVTPTFAVGDALTFGAGDNAGLFIKVNDVATDTANTGVIARVSNASTAKGLLEIALV